MVRIQWPCHTFVTWEGSNGENPMALHTLVTWEGSNGENPIALALPHVRDLGGLEW